MMVIQAENYLIKSKSWLLKTQKLSDTSQELLAVRCLGKHQNSVPIVRLSSVVQGASCSKQGHHFLMTESVKILLLL